MKRREVPGDLRFLTFSCYDRRPHFADATARTLFAHHLAAARSRARFLLIAWVIMPEHVHLLIRPALTGPTVEQILTGLKSHFARRLFAHLTTEAPATLTHMTDSHAAPRFWQHGGGYDRNITTRTQCLRKIVYIHKNPVKRGLVGTPTEWPWSSARAYRGDPQPLAPIDRVD